MKANYVPLADAIMLGSAITKARATNLDYCGLGMAANAVGIPTCYDLFHESTGRREMILQRWPWLYNSWGEDSCWNWIAGNFNTKVCPDVGESTMALEELCVEVKKMEAVYVLQPYPQPSTLPLDTARETDKIALAQE